MTLYILATLSAFTGISFSLVFPRTMAAVLLVLAAIVFFAF